MELDAAPVVDRVMTYIIKTGCSCSSDEHRHVLHIESADEEKTFTSETCCISLHILKKDVSVDIGKENVIAVTLKERGVAAPCLYYLAHAVKTCVVIC